jgi:hypothetical protein
MLKGQRGMILESGAKLAAQMDQNKKYMLVVEKELVLDAEIVDNSIQMIKTKR